MNKPFVKLVSWSWGLLAAVVVSLLLIEKNLNIWVDLGIFIIVFLLAGWILFRLYCLIFKDTWREEDNPDLQED